jgi:hypothetical protein
MAAPGFVLNIADGNLGLSQGSGPSGICIFGVSLGGVVNQLYSFGDIGTLTGTLVGGRGAELAAHCLKVGGPLFFMPLNPSVKGGVSSPVKVGTSTGSMSASALPHQSITIVTTTPGTLGTAAFTFALGSGAPSAPVVSAASWSSTGYAIPGTFATLIFTAGTYTAGGTPDTYTVSTLGAFAHPVGTGPTVPTGYASPIDDYTPTVICTLGGALGLAQFTYSLDGTVSSTSATVTTSAGGQYAIPGTGIVLSFSGPLVAGDYWTFQCAAPTFSNTDLNTALGLLNTTYLAQANFAMGAVDGGALSASAWATQAGNLETAALSLFANGVYVRFVSGCPTLGTVLPNGSGGVTVDSTDTDTAVIAARGTISAPHVNPCAGDALMVAPVSGLSLRRNALWPVAARSSKVEASKSIGAVSDGGLTSVTKLYRNENSTPGFDPAGITSLCAYAGGGLNGYYVLDAHTGALSTSDYYPWTNARVIDRASVIVRSVSLGYINAKIPTKAGGVITEKAAQKIESAVTAQLVSRLVSGYPQDAIAAKAVVNRTNNLLGTSQLLITATVQPFGTAKTVVVTLGMTVVP